MNSEGPTIGRLGLIGGISWRSSALYYDRVNAEMERRHGRHANAPGLLVTLPYSPLLAAGRAGRFDLIEAHIVDAGRQLAAQGCDVVALCAMTAHMTYQALANALPAAIPHILSGVAVALRKRKVRSVGILATEFTRRAGFLHDYLADTNWELIFPDANDQSSLDELINGTLTCCDAAPDDRGRLARIVRSLADRRADCVVLACTELPLLLPLEDAASLPPVLDPIDTHVNAICDALTTSLDRHSSGI